MASTRRATGHPRVLTFVTRKWAVVAGCALAGAFGAGCESLIGIPDVTLESADGSAADALVTGESGSFEAGAGGCGVTADGAARPGPVMVRIDSPLGSYCIDTTEVTIGQFNAYVIATSGAPVDTPDACANALPTPVVDNTSDPQLPVDDLGVCHAWSYCQWAGKRLCGMIGDGGAVPYGTTPQNTEWVYACVNGVQNDGYPYGTSYVPQVCNIDDAGGGPVEVKSMSGCHGTTAPFDQIYDMVGNVWEFVNTLYAGGDYTVYPAGGAWDTPLADLSSGGCLYMQSFNGVIADEPESGFRCCADP
jgi:formylglycine-generating enzyme required for sulfatase activity